MDNETALFKLPSRRCATDQQTHAYVRVNTSRFYHCLRARGTPLDFAGTGSLDLRLLPRRKARGPIANADGDIDTEIRDLDQTVIGNPTHDAIRSVSICERAFPTVTIGMTRACTLRDTNTYMVIAVEPDKNLNSYREFPWLQAS